jgi:hypothetical protein
MSFFGGGGLGFVAAVCVFAVSYVRAVLKSRDY